VVDYGVPDISKYVTRVVEMHGNKENRTIYTPQSGMRLGWGRDDGPFFFSCPGRNAA
jgi:hypothetical protein